MNSFRAVRWATPAIVFLASCSREPPPTPPSTDLARHERIAAAVRSAESVVLYEGLPQGVVAAAIVSAGPKD
jgi:hypothetical protein